MANKHEKPPQIEVRRRFEHAGAGFRDGTAHVEFKGAACTLVGTDGSLTHSQHVTLADAEHFVAQGMWKEVPDRDPNAVRDRLFYYDDAAGANLPVPADVEGPLLDWLFGKNSNMVSIELAVKRVEMTDGQFQALAQFNDIISAERSE